MRLHVTAATAAGAALRIQPFRTDARATHTTTPSTAC